MTLQLFVIHEDAGFAADEEGNQHSSSSYLRLYLYLKFVTGSKLSLALVVVVAMVVKEEGQQAEQLSPRLPATKTSILHSHNYCIITLPAT